MSRGIRMVVGAIVGLIFGIVLIAAIDMSARADLHSTWPESDEFVHLPTGQDRFSEHETNVRKWMVVVDHETGAQYIASVDGDAICPILDKDGTPLLVDEAGE